EPEGHRADLAEVGRARPRDLAGHSAAGAGRRRRGFRRPVDRRGRGPDRAGRAPDAQDRGPARPPGRGADGEPVALQAGHMSAQGLAWRSAPRQGSGSGRTEHPVVGGCGGGNPPGGWARSAPPHAELMTWELIPADVERLAALVTERSGLAFPESRWPFLRNR